MLVKKAIDKGAAQADPEDATEAPEQPGEQPDVEDASESPEAQDAGAQTGDAGEGEANVSPEEQAIYETVVIAAQAMIYGKGTRDAIVQKLKLEANRPEVGIGHTAAMIAMSIRGGAQKEGKDIPDDVLFAAGQEIVADLVEVAIAAGIVKEADKEEVFKKSVFEGLRTFGESEKMQGQITPQVQQEARGALQDQVAQAQAENAPKAQGAVSKAMGEEQ
jgi:hypothetical protein